MNRMDAESTQVRAFLAAHAPFDMLPSSVLDQISHRSTHRNVHRGTVVLDVGDQTAGLYVVRSGAVDVLDEGGELVERVGSGGAFGMSSLLERRPARFRCTATEDTLLLILTPELFDALVRDHHGFAAFYATSHHDRLSKAVANLHRAASGAVVLGTSVRDLMSHGPVVAQPGASVEQAAAAMSRQGVSSILIADEGQLTGIVTDRDLRSRVLATGGDPHRPVREVMSSPAITVRPDGAAFEALLEMVSNNIHHLPVVDDHGQAVGIVTTADLLRLDSSNPVHLAADIGRQTTVAGVVSRSRQIPAVLAQLVDRDVSAADIGRVVTALGDAVRRRVIALAAAEQGGAPCGYAWVVLGSVARQEEALSADQDHALVIADSGHDSWFAQFADRVTAVLASAGWPRCPGEVMATNARWRLTVDQWRRLFIDWSAEPTPDSTLQAAIFHDMRHLAGDPRLTMDVRGAATAFISPRFLGHLGALALRMTPPLGFFRGFVLERHGEHRDTLDIKRGITIVVQLARVHALRCGSTALTTRDRIAAAADAGVIDVEAATDLTDALELMSYRRLYHQVAQIHSGKLPDNRLDPGELTERQRRHLKDAFAIVRSSQQQLANRHGSGYL